MNKVISWFKKDPANYILVAFVILIVPIIILGIMFPAGEGAGDNGIFGDATGKVITISSLISMIFGMLNVTLYSKMDHNNHKQKQALKWLFIFFNSISIITLAISDLAGQRYVNVFVDSWFLVSMVLQFFVWFKVRDPREKEEIQEFKGLTKGSLFKYLVLLVLIGVLLGMLEYIIFYKLTDIGQNNLFGSDDSLVWLWSLFDGITASSMLVASVLLAKKNYNSLIMYFIGDFINIIYFSLGVMLRSGSMNWPLTGMFIFYLTTNIINYINWRFIMPKKQLVKLEVEMEKL